MNKRWLNFKFITSLILLAMVTIYTFIHDSSVNADLWICVWALCLIRFVDVLDEIQMQTFLPYSNFNRSLNVLDWRRLGKQRVEAHQILNVLLERTDTKGWHNHPITRMWTGYESALKLYFNLCVQEWMRRGYNNNMELEDVPYVIRYPEWLGNELFHSSHRANLLRKDSEFYSKQGWSEDSTNPYAWFDTDKHQWYLQHVGTGIREYI